MSFKGAPEGYRGFMRSQERLGVLWDVSIGLRDFRESQWRFRGHKGLFGGTWGVSEKFQGF